MGNKKNGYRYTDEDLKNNFIEICNTIGRVPLFNEFSELTKISDITYANRLGLKGKVYDKIVEHYVSDEEFNRYIKEKSEHKTQVGKHTGSLSILYSNDTLETNFRYIFDTCMSKYNTYPSRRYFDKISPIDSSIYRRRLEKSWTDVCKMYGYIIKSKNIEETICLNMCKEIIQSDYIPQKTWDWLIGVGGKHMYCDGYFSDINTVIEFDGRGHRIPIAKFGGYDKMIRQQENDILKEKLLREHGINIIRIDSRIQWQNENVLSSILDNHIKVS